MIDNMEQIKKKAKELLKELKNQTQDIKPFGELVQKIKQFFEEIIENGN